MINKALERPKGTKLYQKQRYDNWLSTQTPEYLISLKREFWDKWKRTGKFWPPNDNDDDLEEKYILQWLKSEWNYYSDYEPKYYAEENEWDESLCYIVFEAPERP